MFQCSVIFVNLRFKILYSTFVVFMNEYSCLLSNIFWNVLRNPNFISIARRFCSFFHLCFTFVNSHQDAIFRVVNRDLDFFHLDPNLTHKIVF